jgi:hypothetical protein
MTPNQLRKAIKDLGFKSAYEFGAWIHKKNPEAGRRQARRWLAGTQKIPASVELAIELKLQLEDVK